MSAATIAATTRPAPQRRIQRACACGTCEKCRKKKLQREADGSGAVRLPLPGGLNAGGTPLPHPVRRHLEPLFGTGFADVRVHDDGIAHRTARDLRANAFTWGQHIHFGSGQFQPQSGRGLHLLAHELTHTIQQRGTAPLAATDAIEVDAPDTPMEREADSIADAIVAGRTPGFRPSSVAAGRLQRDAIPGEAEIDRPDGSGGGVRIHRTMQERDCTSEAQTERTPADRIFRWDEDAHAIALHYTLCHGSVRLTTNTSIDYSNVVEAGQRLLRTLQNNPAAGADLSTLGRQAIDEASLEMSGAVTLDVDGVLQLRVGAEGEAGTGEQAARITGRLTIAPGGDVTLVIRGGAGISHTGERDLSRYSLGLLLGTRWFQIDLDYLREERNPIGGSTTITDRGTGTITIPIPGMDIAPFLRGQAEHGPGGTSGSVIIGIGGSIPEPTRPRRPDCYTCRCLPPLPRYRCTPYGTRQVVEREADTRRPALLYQYDSDQPANRTDFDAQVAAIASLVGQGYAISAIRGHASPEGSVPYNLDLGRRRAEQARSQISTQLPAGADTLPPAEAVGEVLGESSGTPGQEARNHELTAELVARLGGLGDEQRLELLGIEGARRSDPAQRRQALDDIEAFVQGQDARGRRLRGRARWERVFPFLRRVEVEVQRPAVTRSERVDRTGEGDECAPGNRAYIDQQRPIPDAARLPTRRCGP